MYQIVDYQLCVGLWFYDLIYFPSMFEVTSEGLEKLLNVLKSCFSD